jgi:hypothetical protein
MPSRFLRAFHQRCASFSTQSPPPLAPPSAARTWTDAEVRAALSERSMLVREMEGSSFRRAMYLTGAFLLIKYAKMKLAGSANDSA